MHKSFSVCQDMFLVPISKLLTFYHPPSFSIHTWFCTTHFYLIAPLFLFSFFASSILSILGDFYIDRAIGGIWIINYACINQCSRLNLHNPMALQLLIEQAQKFIPQIFLYNLIAKTANGAMIGRDVFHINVKKLSKADGVVNTPFNGSVTQIIPRLQKQDLKH